MQGPEVRNPAASNLARSLNRALNRALNRSPNPSAFVLVPALCIGMAVASVTPAAARTDRDEQVKQAQSIARPTTPLKLIVSIRRQRVSVWEGMRKIADSPISSGMSGHDTPTGVFSILEKNRVHFSNLYNDAPMPFMQRLTWSGVALHAGALPGYPASHGCIRLPYSFAKQLFDLTRVGARVIVARDDIEPRPVTHPKLPVPLPPTDQVADVQKVNTLHTGGDAAVDMLIGVRSAEAATGTASAFVPRRTRASVAAQRAAEIATLADEIRRAEGERDEAAVRAGDAARTTRDAQDAVSQARSALPPLQAARESARRGQTGADAQLKTFVERNRNDLDDAALASLGAQEDELERRIEAAAFEIQDIDAEMAEKTRQIDALAQTASLANWQQHLADDALAKSNRALKDAQAAKIAAERALQRRNLPITVFVSRKTGKLSVRQGFEPLFDAAVQIDNPEAPLGTHVFTALDYESGERALSWSVVSVATAAPEPDQRASRARNGKSASEPATARPSIPQTAATTLARIHIPDDVLERIAEFMRPGSTFMISDLDISNETGKGTDFVLLTR